MRKIREVMRLRLVCNLTIEKIAVSCGISDTTVRNYLTLAAGAKIDWQTAETLSDGELEERLFPRGPAAVGGTAIDFEHVYLELKRKGVTKQLLWYEYLEGAEEGYSYSQYCRLYREWLRQSSVSMRQDHKAGEKAFVDFAGTKVPIYGPGGKVAFEASIFVGVLGASQYAYAEAVASESLENFLSAHVRMMNFFGGSPEIVVIDNLRAGVTKACRYEPDLNPTYHAFSRHYGFAVVPTRVRSPKDKAKAENAVGLVTRWIIAALRNRKFFSVAELNEAIRILLERLNSKMMQKIPESRRSLFEKLDKPALKALPSKAYEFAEIITARVNIDYHIAVKDHYYSVPYQYIKRIVTAKVTASAVEIYFNNQRVAVHARNFHKYRHTTIKDHMPKNHQFYSEWNAPRIVAWAKTIGESVASTVEEILKTREHPELAYRSCLGLIRLEKKYGKDRLDAACKRALHFKACSYKSIKRMLEACLDSAPLAADPEAKPIHHANIRGGNYYLKHKGEENDGHQSNDRETEGTASSWDDQSPRGPAANACKQGF